MQNAFAFVNPIHIKGLVEPTLSKEMMYLMTTDVEQKGKSAILRQLSRLFEIDLEEFLHSPLEEKPLILMTYDPLQDELKQIERLTQRIADVVEKMGHVRRYQVQHYCGGANILDLDLASADESEDRV